MKKECVSSIWGKFKKILTLFIITVFMYSSTGFCFIKDLGLGYRYCTTQTIKIGIAQEKDIISVAIDEYLDKLEEEGYNLASHQLNVSILSNFGVIKKSEINTEEIKQKIINNLDVEAFLTKVKIENDETDYYFKSEDEAKEFIKTLNKYIEQEYELEDVIEDIKLVTDEDVLDEVIKVAASIKVAKVTSRGTSSTRESNTSSSITVVFPLQSYSYISSSYGMRNGSMHTGTDFAAAAGTHVYAWKSGTVTQASWNGGYGNFIEIQHNDGTISRYAHLSGYAISSGQTVYAGQIIGYVGTTGNSTR